MAERPAGPARFDASSPAPIRNISDTALWVAVYRALESERRAPLFRDPYARRLAGPRGEAISHALAQRSRMAWAIVVRTCLLDEQIMACVARGADSVLNLAAGLDARPWRMELPPALRWYDVDLPPILSYKRELLGNQPARCRVEWREVDLADAQARRALLAEVAREARRTVVITEGLLIYLESEAVVSLARDLHASPNVVWWLLDLVSPELLQRMDRWGARLRAANAPLRFAPAEGGRFFEPYGWREAEFRSFVSESRRLGRALPVPWPWRLLARLAPAEDVAKWQRSAGIVRLERS